MNCIMWNEKNEYEEWWGAIKDTGECNNNDCSNNNNIKHKPKKQKEGGRIHNEWL